MKELVVDAKTKREKLKLGPTKIWTGLVLHHKDIFVSHVLPNLNAIDQYFFSDANTESFDVLKYAGVGVSKLEWGVSKMFIHFDVGRAVESFEMEKMGKEN
jgi:hypothetical protein|tara:strand:+ start:354 stop:656 length:303 start_codon:yes stop_codon:yes gene_type:complete